MDEFERQLEKFLGKQPTFGKTVFVARGAVIVGDVTLGDHASIWYNAVLRADINRIVVGHHTNVQDNSVLHLSDELPCQLGNYVTVGHNAILHGCTIEDEALIGMGATVLDGARVGTQSLVGAGALVPQGAKVPAGSLVLGSPARVVRVLTPDERAAFKQIAEKYVAIAQFCLKRGINVSMGT